MVWGSIAAQKYHMRWFEKHLPKDGSVAIRRFGINLVGLSIAGPNARKVLEKLTDDDVSGHRVPLHGFPQDGRRRCALHGEPHHLYRRSRLRDLDGTRPTSAGLPAIKQAGAEFGIVDFGMRALLSMRLEKNFPTWFRELRPIYGPYEAGMDRFIKLVKNDFIGREAAAKEHADGPKLMRTSFLVDALDADVMGDEPVWARVGDTDYGTVEPPTVTAHRALTAMAGDRQARRRHHARWRLARGRLGHLGRLCPHHRQHRWPRATSRLARHQW
jgi:dimethylglycine dehydrogenase